MRKLSLSFNASKHDPAKFLRELSLMLDSGLSLSDATVLSSRNKPCLDAIRHGIEQGEPFSRALKCSYPNMDNMAVSFIEMGERTGDLSKGIIKAARFIENKDRFRKKMIGSLTYPIVTILLSFTALLFLISVLLPAFENIYSEMELNLPLISRLVAGTGRFMVNNAAYILLLSLAAAYLIVRFCRTPDGAIKVDRLMLKAPFVGSARSEFMIARLFDNLYQSVSSGMSVPDSLAMSGRALGSPVYRNSLIKTERDVRAGKSLSGSLSKEIFPELSLDLIAAGEATAKLDLIFAELRDHYEENIERRTKVILNLVEPISTLVVGAVVAIIVLAMFMPMINLVNLMTF